MSAKTPLTDSPGGDVDDSPFIDSARALAHAINADLLDIGDRDLFWIAQERVIVGWLMDLSRPIQGNESNGDIMWARSDAVH